MSVLSRLLDCDDNRSYLIHINFLYAIFGPAFGARLLDLLMLQRAPLWGALGALVSC